MRTIIALIAIMLSFPAHTEEPRPDRKDYAIEAIQRQRNDALTREAMCYADLSPEIDRLKARVAELEKAAANKKE